MAKKAELLEEAKKLGLEVDQQNTIAEIEAAIKTHSKTPLKNDDSSDEDEHFAKSGKRSKKATDEVEAEIAKEERKAKIASGEIDSSTNEEGEVASTKGPIPIPRPLSERRSKRFQEVAKEIDQKKEYAIDQAVALAQKTSTVKFDASVELHINLGVDPKHADQNIRGSLTLPHGTGKTQKVAVFAPENLHDDAKKAGADQIYGDDLLDKLKAEDYDFDVLISTPENMPKLGRFAKSLGPKGLMPNPKSGTVTKDVAKAVSEAKAGKIEFRVDKSGIVHNSIGKVSFKASDLTENAEALINAIKDAKPASLKTEYLQKITMTTSMGPAIRVAK